MFQKARRMSKWKDKLRIIFARPGWLPEELGGYQAPPEVDKGTYTKYDTANLSKPMNWYVLVQFVSIVLGTSAFIYHFDNISTSYKLIFLGVLMLSLLICGAIFENRRWVMIAEYARLLLVVFALNTFYYFWHIDWFSIMFGASLFFFVVFVVWFSLTLVLDSRKAVMVNIR
jgi:hypothetical protein